MQNRTSGTTSKTAIPNKIKPIPIRSIDVANPYPETIATTINESPATPNPIIVPPRPKTIPIMTPNIPLHIGNVTAAIMIATIILIALSSFFLLYCPALLYSYCAVF